MRGPGCARVGSLLARRTAGLSESERLVIEDHLAGCAHCRDEARWLGGIVALTRGATGSVGSSARDRLLRQAIDAAGTTVEPEVPRPRSRRRAAIGLALAAGAALLLLALRPWLASSPAPDTARLAPATATDRIETGRLHAGEDALAPGDAVPHGRPMVAMAGTRMRLAHARVTTDDAELVWHAEHDRLFLTRGGVRVSVDATKGRAFAVDTPRFSVEVVGTAFEVHGRGVRVWSGVVRVVAPDGAVLARALGAGESWSLPAGSAAPSTGPAPTAPAPENQTTEQAAEQAARQGQATKQAAGQAAGREPTPAAAAAARSADEWLASARAHLAGRRLSKARQAVAAALDTRPARRDEAEARTLLAECAQAEGDHAEAARLYRMVAERYADLPAGENALFAAARAEARAGRAAEAHALHRTYLERYPAGRFAAEVDKQLQRSGTP